MKITIVQREIEEAIRQYVHTQINVKEGHEITMDFTNTRGEDGLIAAIDISPIAPPKGGKSAGRQTTAREDKSAAPTTVRSAPAKPEPQEVTQAVDDLNAVVIPEAASDAPTVSETPKASIFGSARSVPTESVSAVEEEDELVPGDRPLGKSIFGDLSRPSNAEGAVA